MDLSRFDTPRYLSVLPLFGDCRPADLQHLAEDCQLTRYARGEPVFRCGDPCDAFHVVVTGQVKLHAISASGQEKVIRLVGAGYSFGETLVFGQRPCSVNATALGDTLVLTLRKQALLAEVARDPRLALRLLAGMSEQVHGLMSDVEAYALHSGTQRVVNYLLRERRPCEDGGSLVSLPVSKATIASRLSITPEYFSRVLAELEAGHMISVQRRDIRIVDAQRLARHGLQ
ncbi:Crp/Fnr family transcriptional regulator [Azohydromonas lata]|uniref:Crp/Fnr family transcriptional regulator n=1 Tax=Azohydromonas lata TaxID=45677 RepID=A0ABU5ILB4_9BURK|nr:Crp/Fnr family transcriptional regulator [Azohydromonas lata]MDZ5459670.1 Crp/Fnr family transcriptional regulator [Azohydromonas lata]